MNDADFTEMLEARLRLTYHDVAVATPRPRYAAGRAAGLRRAVRVPALLATPVLAFFSVAVVAGASTVAKTVVTGDPNPLDWGPRHAVVVPAAPAVDRGNAGGHDRAHPTPLPGRGGGAADGNGHGGSDGGTENGSIKQPGSHGSGGPGSTTPSDHGKSGRSS